MTTSSEMFSALGLPVIWDITALMCRQCDEMRFGFVYHLSSIVTSLYVHAKTIEIKFMGNMGS